MNKRKIKQKQEKKTNGLIKSFKHD